MFFLQKMKAQLRSLGRNKLNMHSLESLKLQPLVHANYQQVNILSSYLLWAAVTSNWSHLFLFSRHRQCHTACQQPLTAARNKILDIHNIDSIEMTSCYVSFFLVIAKKSHQAKVREARLAASAKRKERVDPRSF